MGRINYTSSVGALLMCFIMFANGQKQTWITHTNKSLRKQSDDSDLYITLNHIYDTLPEAQAACEDNWECGGVTYEPRNTWYTLRRGRTLSSSSSGEVSYTIDTEIVDRSDCKRIDLRAHNHEYLTVTSSGYIYTSRRPHTDSLVALEPYFDTNGLVSFYSRSSGYDFKAFENGDLNAKRYLPNQYAKQFRIHRRGDKLAFRTYYGKYISVDSRGKVSAKSSNFGKNEEFYPIPGRCLKEDDCTQDLPVDAKRWTLLTTKYDIDKSHIYEYPPRRITMQHTDNRNGSRVQGTRFIASETIAETISYSHTAGAGITLGTEFKAGIPLIGHAKASVHLTVEYEFSYGKESTEEITYSAKYSCDAPPGKIVECMAFMQSTKMTVPYNMTWRNNRNWDCLRYVVGTLTKVVGDKMKMKVYEYD